MNNYVVAFISFHENELFMEEVMAETAVQAAIKYLNNELWGLTEDMTLEQVKDQLFEADFMINVLNVSRTGRPGDGLQTHLAQFDSAAKFH